MTSIFSIVPLAAVDSINVLALLAVSYVWVLTPSRGTYLRTATSFVAGGVCGLALALMFSFTVLLTVVKQALDRFPPAAIASILVLMAIGVIAISVRGFLHPPTSLPVDRAVRPAGAYALGLLTWAAQSLTSAPFYGAIAVMEDESTATRVTLSAVFVLIALMPVASLLVALALVPRETGKHLLIYLRRALPVASRVVSIILIIGSVIVGVIAIRTIAG